MVLRCVWWHGKGCGGFSEGAVINNAVWCRWNLAWCSDSHPADMEVGVLRAGVDLGLVWFCFTFTSQAQCPLYREEVEGRWKLWITWKWLVLDTASPRLFSVLALPGLWGFFAPKYTDLLVKGSFVSGFGKLKCKICCFVKSYIYKIEKSSAVVVCLNWCFSELWKGNFNCAVKRMIKSKYFYQLVHMSYWINGKKCLKLVIYHVFLC